MFQLRLLAAAALLGQAAAKHSSAELRRYTGADCKGDYEVMNTDMMDTCAPKFIPGPASIKIEYVNETTYATYHYKDVVDCSGSTREFLEFLSVGPCVNDPLEPWSQKRAWIDAPTPPTAKCAAPGTCGIAYEACCLGAKATGKQCTCHLHNNGTGTAHTSSGCGTCGKAFVACCAAFDLKGYPCTCDITDAPANAATMVI
eukprot:TRINITY_DN21872_c0_g1_i2.p1 TRINITY_DN21872_c0_g1~~TRINITY_DN21872_c0_g1_i2.p1  ORF type:complete len:218 (-),score=41.81 TRINITY_DN21872_c0_g1_i2:217-819(-)